MSVADVTIYFELISYIVTIFGLPIAILVFYLDRRKERSDSEAEALSHTAERYVAFLELSLEYPELDIFTTPVKGGYEPSPLQVKQENSLIAILIDMFESAFLKYQGQNDSFRIKQWNGWVSTIKSYCYRDNFLREWSQIGSQFDSDFQEFMDSLIADKP